MPRLFDPPTPWTGAGTGHLPYRGTDSVSLKPDFSLNGSNIANGLTGKSQAQTFNYLVDNNDASNPLELDFSGLRTKVTARNKEGVAVQRLVSFNPFKLYLDDGDVDFNQIQFSPATKNVSISAPKVTIQHTSADSNPQATWPFTFYPGSQDSRTLTYPTSDTASYNTTNGSSTSNSSSKELSYGVTRTQTESLEIGADGLGKAGIQDSKAVQSGWSNAWTSMNEVSFSKSSGKSSTNAVTSSITLMPGTAKLNPKNNSYIYTAEVEQPDGSFVSKSFGLVPALNYVAHIYRTISTLKSNLSGAYNINGGVGTLTDSVKGVSVSPSVQQALLAAKNAGYKSWEHMDLSGFDFQNSDKFGVDFTGTATGSSRIATSFLVKYAEASQANNAQSSVQANDNAQSSGQSKDNLPLHNQKFDLKDFDSTELDGLGVYHAFHEKSTGQKSVTGTGYEDLVHASSLGTHHFSKFKASMLHGNDAADTFNLAKKYSGNHISAFGGDDVVQAASSQTVDLGSGNDRYVIRRDAVKGSHHQMLTGDGKDTLWINRSDITFTIADFNPFLDQVRLGRGMKQKLLSARLVPFDGETKIIDNAQIDFYYGKKLIGTAHLDCSDPDVVNDLVDPFIHDKIDSLNSKSSKRNRVRDDDTAFEAFEKLVEKGIAYSRPILPDGLRSLSTASDVNSSSEIVNESVADLI